MASLVVREVALHIDFFEASAIVHLRYGLPVCKSCLHNSFLEGSDGFVSSPAASIATGLAILTQAGLSPASF